MTARRAALVAAILLGVPKVPRAAAVIDLGTLLTGAEKYRVSVIPGSRGLLDAAIRIGGGGEVRVVRGLRVVVRGSDLAAAESTGFLSAEVRRISDGITAAHRFALDAGPCTVGVAVRIAGACLCVSVWMDSVPPASPFLEVRLEEVSFGTWDAPPERIYAGDGNVLVRPAAFTLMYDGHQLSTSFIGLEWKQGPAMVVATDAVPDRLDVDPAGPAAAIRAPGAQEMLVVPGTDAWSALAAWREARAPVAAAGVRALAGRFAIDLWGGTFTEATAALHRSYAYGMTDAVVVWHNWQRHGYDVGLPDIWPPNPERGTVPEFRALADLCRTAGALFAPHDNYIDYYPDAEGFGPDRLCHDDKGRPVKAWFNAWANAQSFRWRPDRVRPAIERNLALVRGGVQPTAYFTDVWSSIGPHDWRDRDGTFHPREETRRLWREYFAWMRNFLGGAPQISESGHDALVGWLDGAQANHLRVDPGAAGWFVWKIRCADAERVPWLDFALHDRFALHGAGYEDRYAAGVDTRLHGMYSDDYFATELLTGHPGMVKDAFSAEAVRTYWLLHAVGRALAGRRIAGVEFADGDIHRQRVRWEDGGLAEVNRGGRDWNTGGRTLPPFGFHARAPVPGGMAECAVEHVGMAWREWARWPGGLYLGARAAPRLIRVRAEGLRDTGSGSFELRLAWDAPVPADLPFRLFVHFIAPDGKIVFQGDHEAPVSATAWSGTVHTVARVRVPEAIRAGDAFPIMAGMWDPKSGGRPELEGPDDGQRRYRLGTLHIGEHRNISWEPAPAALDPAAARRNRAGTVVDLDGVSTDGACRIATTAEHVTITPLPGAAPFTVRLRADLLPVAAGANPPVAEVLDMDGKTVGVAAYARDRGDVTLSIPRGVFAFRIGLLFEVRM